MLFGKFPNKQRSSHTGAWSCCETFYRPKTYSNTLFFSSIVCCDFVSLFSNSVRVTLHCCVLLLCVCVFRMMWIVCLRCFDLDIKKVNRHSTTSFLGAVLCCVCVCVRQRAVTFCCIFGDLISVSQSFGSCDYFFYIFSIFFQQFTFYVWNTASKSFWCWMLRFLFVSLSLSLSHFLSLVRLWLTIADCFLFIEWAFIIVTLIQYNVVYHVNFDLQRGQQQIGTKHVTFRRTKSVLQINWIDL